MVNFSALTPAEPFEVEPFCCEERSIFDCSLLFYKANQMVLEITFQKDIVRMQGMKMVDRQE